MLSRAVASAWIVVGLSGCCAHESRAAQRAQAASAMVVGDGTLEEPTRDDLLRAIRPFDEFVRRCTSGPHRVFAVAVLTFSADGRVADADIDTGEAASNECARRLLLEMRIEGFRSPTFIVAFPFRVYSSKPTRVRSVDLASQSQMTFAPELCLWGASSDGHCRDEREANAVDCPTDAR